MKQYRYTVLALVVAAIALSGCSNALSLTQPNNKGAIQSAVLNGSGTKGVLTYSGNSAALSVTSTAGYNAKAATFTLTFNAPVDFTGTNVPGLTISNAVAPTTAGQQFTAGTAIPYTASVVAAAGAYNLNVTLDLTATGITNPILVYVDATKLTANGGQSKLDLVGDNVGGEASDSGYLALNVTGGVAVVGATPQPVFAVGGPTKVAAGAVSFAFNAAATQFVSTALSDTAVPASATNLTVNTSSFVLQRFNYATRAWVNTGIVPDYNTTNTGKITFVLPAAATFNDNYRVQVQGPSSAILETTAVLGFKHSVSYNTQLQVANLSAIQQTGPGAPTPTATLSSTINSGVSIASVTPATVGGQLTVKVVFTGLSTWNTTSTSYGLDPTSISNSTLWVSSTDSTTGSSITGPLVNLAWATAVTSSSTNNGLVDTVTLTFPKSLKSNSQTYTVYAYGLKDLNNGSPVIIANLGNIPSLALVSAGTFTY